MNARTFLGTAAFLTLVAPALADVRLPHVFGDHMVVQRDKPVRVWGWASPGERVQVRLAGNSATATADANGEWKLALAPLPAGGPHQMTVAGKNTVQLEDVLIGEVWIASGQSNMEFGLKYARNAKKEMDDANYPGIRLFLVPRTSAALPLNDIQARWFVCSPREGALGDFSAVAYFFGREIHKSLTVPVGLIAASQGATQIEVWTPPEGLAEVPSLKPALEGVTAAENAARKQMAVNLDQWQALVRQGRSALTQDRQLPPELFAGNPIPTEGGPVLYNGMIHPVVPFAIRGALWYQGESNCGDGPRYLDKMKALVAGWRKVWQQGDFPFYYVQITPNNYDGRLPFLLEAQNQAMAIPNTGMAASTDTCDPSDHFGGGHPANKQEIGHRLALWALAKDYGRKEMVCSGPRLRMLEAMGKQLRVRFDSVGGGLVTRDGRAPDSFEIAGVDGKFVDAKARIDGETVVIGSDEVSEPRAMRFAWKDLAQPNLMNKEGLPVSVFRAELKGP